jgi:hypothetical protein
VSQVLGGANVERMGMLNRAKGKGRGGGNAPHLVKELDGQFTIHEVLQIANRASRPHLGLMENHTGQVICIVRGSTTRA